MADEFPLTAAQATPEDVERLGQRIEEIKSSNAALQRENAMFEGYISRLEQQAQTLREMEAGQGGATRVRRQRSRSDTADHVQLLTMEQKCYVARSEVESMKQDLEKLNQRRQRIHDHYMATMEEAEIRLQEIRKAREEFERKVVKPLKESKWKMKEPDAVFRCLEDKSKATLLEMLRLKNQALVAEENELRNKLKMKADREKPLNQEDLDQVPGGCALEDLQAKNFGLQEILRIHQKKLQAFTKESERLSREIAKKMQSLRNMDSIIMKAKQERVKVESLNNHLQQLLLNYKAPDTLDYMDLKMKQKQLQHEVVVLERKAAIAKNVTHRKVSSQVRAAPTAANSPESDDRIWGKDSQRRF